MTRQQTLLDQLEQEALNDQAPLAGALRKCIALGGRSGSAELRDWATKELRGYEPGDDLPNTRVVPAPLKIDAINSAVQFTGRQVSPINLPEAVRGSIREEVRVYQGVGEIEAILNRSDSSVKLLPPRAADIVALMNYEVAEPYQQIIALYWDVSTSALRGVLDQVRTTLVQLVAEMRTHLSQDEDVPSAESATQAVNVAVYGSKRTQVTVQTGQSGAGGSTQVGGQASSDGPWRRWGRAGAFVAGLAGVAGAIFAGMQYFH